MFEGFIVMILEFSEVALDWNNKNPSFLAGLTFLATTVGLYFVARQIKLAKTVHQTEHLRQKRLETLEFYNQFRKFIRDTHLNIKNHFSEDLKFVRLSPEQSIKLRSNPELRGKLLEVLALLERLGVGVRLQVYDEDIIYATSRVQFMSMWAFYEEYIIEARSTPSGRKAYEEFEMMILRFVERSREDGYPLSEIYQSK